MDEIKGRTYADNEVVRTDDTRFVECNFENATLAYAGGVHPAFKDCTFGDTGWRFDDAALRTVQFLQMINNSDGGRGFIEDLFQPGKFIAQ
ncbi:MAG TPA: hypothetical protein VJS15_08965 [Allosphingosinicella sp.]|nr:hypothetical protein [Allosphingosinicella sp.]